MILSSCSFNPKRHGNCLLINFRISFSSRPYLVAIWVRDLQWVLRDHGYARDGSRMDLQHSASSVMSGYHLEWSRRPDGYWNLYFLSRYSTAACSGVIFFFLNSGDPICYRFILFHGGRSSLRYLARPGTGFSVLGFGRKNGNIPISPFSS